jgi:hypothetical protein
MDVNEANQLLAIFVGHQSRVRFLLAELAEG